MDYHPSDQYVALVDTETGEYEERQLNHSAGEAEKFYRELATRGVSVRVGMEATGYSRWFERLLAELGMELWIGDAAKIKTKRVCKQKTTVRTPDCCCDRCGKITFRASGYPVLRIVTCDNCCGTAIAWCRCGRGS
ncbi:MAG: hypothetical protein WA641_15455 [Candidatus Acidiferrales bacterium]